MGKFIGIFAVAVLIAGGAYYFFTQSSLEPQIAAEGDEETEMQELDSSALTGQGTLRSLLGLGQNVKCEFVYIDDENDNTTSGTVYVAGERMRGDFDMMQDNEPYSMHMIRDAEYAYTWGDGPMGEMATKMKLETQTPTEANSTDPVDTDPFESDERVDYECESWTVAASQFTPPSDVEFMDMSAQMEQMHMMQGDMKAAQCAACDQAPEGSREQCRAALGCE